MHGEVPPVFWIPGLDVCMHHMIFDIEMQVPSLIMEQY